MIRRPPKSPLFPHTTLSRSRTAERDTAANAAVVQPCHLVIDGEVVDLRPPYLTDRKSTRLNSSHLVISYAVFCLKKKNKRHSTRRIPCSLTTPLASPRTAV